MKTNCCSFSALFWQKNREKKRKCTRFILLACVLNSSSRFLCTFCLSWISNWCCSSILLSFSLVVLYFMVVWPWFSCSCFSWNLYNVQDRKVKSIRSMKLSLVFQVKQSWYHYLKMLLILQAQTPCAPLLSHIDQLNGCFVLKKLKEARGNMVQERAKTGCITIQYKEKTKTKQRNAYRASV